MDDGRPHVDDLVRSIEGGGHESEFAAPVGVQEEQEEAQDEEQEEQEEQEEDEAEEGRRSVVVG